MSVKAFELVPALERANLGLERTRSQIECIECCGKSLYIGTNDCCVIQYKVEERSVGGKVSFITERLGHKQLTQKKPVQQLKAASALNRVLVLCDNTISLLNMFDLEPLPSGAKVKSVTAFCLNENPIDSNPFSIEICAALRKKQVHVYSVTEDRVQLTRAVDLPELPLVVTMDGRFICVALSSQYMIVDYESGRRQELFPYNPEQTRPLVSSITKGEFLLSAPSALGMFALSTGMSQRPPLQWSDRLVSITYTHPYILALNDEFITVHSILDQQQKQSLPFHGGRWLGEYDGRLFVASNLEIYALVPVPIEKQIQALLEDKRVQEALALAENVRKTELSREQFAKMYQRIQQQAGFIEFSELHFDEARDLLIKGRVDLRELITLYPNLLPTNSNFTRSVPALHEIADVNQLSRGDAAKVSQFKEFLARFLEKVRHTKLTKGIEKEVDTALLKLYAEFNSPELIPLIASEGAADALDCAPILEEHKRHHALALLHRVRGDTDKAVSIWTRIADGELFDELFPGIDFIVEFLSNLREYDIVWKYAEWVLERDEERGAQVFTERPEGEPPSERMREDAVVDFLQRFPRALLRYLEYLVQEKKLEKESYHTHLALLYLDWVLNLNKDAPAREKEEARRQLQKHLQTSSRYRVQLILAKVKDTDMHTEAAILYGKLGDHEKALKILVHKLRDFRSAESYCAFNARDTDRATRQRLMQTLLAVYLDTDNGTRDQLLAPAVALLNNHQNDFDTAKVLDLLPANWSVELVGQFVTSSVRKSASCARTTRLERMLARAENLAVKGELIRLRRDAVQLGEERICAVCNLNFTEPAFVRYPNGVLTHVQCAKNKNVCPVTGKLFSTTAPPVRTK